MGEREQPKVEVEPGGKPYFTVDLSRGVDMAQFDRLASEIFCQKLPDETSCSFLRYIVASDPKGDLMYVFHLVDNHVDFAERLELTKLLSAGRLTIMTNHDGRVVFRKIHGSDIDLARKGLLTRLSSEWYKKNVLGRLLPCAFVIE